MTKGQQARARRGFPVISLGEPILPFARAIASMWSCIHSKIRVPEDDSPCFPVSDHCDSMPASWEPTHSACVDRSAKSTLPAARVTLAKQISDFRKLDRGPPRLTPTSPGCPPAGSHLRPCPSSRVRRCPAGAFSPDRRTGHPVSGRLGKSKRISFPSRACGFRREGLDPHPARSAGPGGRLLRVGKLGWARRTMTQGSSQQRIGGRRNRFHSRSRGDRADPCGNGNGFAFVDVLQEPS